MASVPLCRGPIASCQMALVRSGRIREMIAHSVRWTFSIAALVALASVNSAASACDKCNGGGGGGMRGRSYSSFSAGDYSPDYDYSGGGGYGGGGCSSCGGGRCRDAS